MSEPITSVAVNGTCRLHDAYDCLYGLLKILKGRRVITFLHEKLYACMTEGLRKEFPPDGVFRQLEELDQKPEMILSVGGDGTFLETVAMVGKTSVPIAGINVGRLGFLANISHDHLQESMKLLLDRRYTILQRSLLQLESGSNQLFKKYHYALNEVTLQKSDSNMITIHVSIDDVYLNTYWADGLIISTATGSTAYNLSAGGPIITPESDAMIISPIAPHNLTIRPIVLPGKHVLKCKVEGRTSHCLVTCDSHSGQMSFSEQLQVSQANYVVRTIQPEGQGFFNTLRNKLMWGVDKRN